MSRAVRPCRYRVATVGLAWCRLPLTLGRVPVPWECGAWVRVGIRAGRAAEATDGALTATAPVALAHVT